MKRLLIVLAALLLPVIATAQLAGDVGGSRDWYRDATTVDWTPLNSPLAGINYDVVMDQEYGVWGFTFGYRGGVAPGEGDKTTLISQYTAEYWRVEGGIEWFLGGQGETWSGGGGTTEFLGGPRGGVRFNIGLEPDLELSANYSRGSEKRERLGAVFALRFTSDVSGG